MFTIIPVIELAILIKVGSYIGALSTMAIVILTAVIGAYMVRSEGVGVVSRIQRDMQNGIFPAAEVISGMMILVAGALLLTPGFFTDILGFLMVFPLSREYIKKIATQYIKKKVNPDEIEVRLS